MSAWVCASLPCLQSMLYIALQHCLEHAAVPDLTVFHSLFAVACKAAQANTPGSQLYHDFKSMIGCTVTG